VGLVREQVWDSIQLFHRTHGAQLLSFGFHEASGRNRTPDKLPARERESLFKACDQNLRQAIDIFEARLVIGVGEFAFRRAQLVFPTATLSSDKSSIPSPANPAANRSWADIATKATRGIGVWEGGDAK
jgi:single-strand selective monofunctional uracil DNA glycosylase